jgi:pectate lyase-like protein
MTDRTWQRLVGLATRSIASPTSAISRRHQRVAESWSNDGMGFSAPTCMSSRIWDPAGGSPKIWIVLGYSLSASFRSTLISSRGKEMKSMSLGYINVKDFGAIGNGINDDRSAISNALADAVATNQTLYFPPGTYFVSKYVLVDNVTNMTIAGEQGAILKYPSDDVALVPDGIALTVEMARSGFFLRNCSGIEFRAMSFLGGTNADITINVGSAVYARDTSGTVMDFCQNRQGSSLFKQDAQANDLGTKLIGCDSFGQRGSVRLGNRGQLLGCRFELPDTTDYDRIGNSGSSHAIYFFAGSAAQNRGDIIISGCTFKNIRTTGVKVSGTATPTRNYVITNNVFDDCGVGVVFGADDVQEHSNVTIANNTFIDCGTNRVGWSQGPSINILGARCVNISSNNLFYTRNSIGPVAAVKGIYALKYSETSEPLEDVTISGNVFSALPATTPGSIVTTAIAVAHVGRGSSRDGSCIISSNQILGVGGTGIDVTENVGLQVEHNVFTNVPKPISSTGNRLPVFRFNRISRLASSNAQMRLSFDSFPIVYGNHSSARLGIVQSRGFSVSAGGENPEDHPLLGLEGRVLPSLGRPEIVFAYGAGWRDNDRVNVNGNTFTYKTSPSAPNEFNSISSLIALINNIANIGAEDYGTSFGVATNHIRVRWDISSNTANLFYITATTANKTAGVILPNGGDADLDKTFSRGEAIADGAKRTVVWSPLADRHKAAQLIADNAHAATLLGGAGGVFVPTRTPEDSGHVMVFEHDSPVPSTNPAFRFNLGL